MNKVEFLNELSRNLKGRIDDNELMRQIDYYTSYIQSEIDNGRSEADVINELGNPRLIAKTIVQTYSLKDDPIRNQYKNEWSSGTADEEHEENTEHKSFFGKMHGIAIIGIIVLVIILVIGVLFSVISLLLPIALMALMIFIIIKIFTSLFGSGRR